MPENHATGGAVLVRLPDLMTLLGVSKSTVYHLLKSDPNFPKPLRLTGKAIAWPVAEVHAWIATRPRGTVEEPQQMRRGKAAAGSQA